MLAHHFLDGGFCQNCDLLQLHKDSPPGEKGFFCKECTKGARLLPARLVIVCKQGHLDDFPWNRWAHSNINNPVPVCKEPKLYWKGGRHSGSISNFKVKCTNCSAENSMFGATGKDGIQLYDEEKKVLFHIHVLGSSHGYNNRNSAKNSR
uniref:Uncharacterized protein n=1 Tax=uncultured marine thaumarchaeote SAT1000_12_G12 TaxID=1456380 RepID=A0A075I5G8_9ARCH|nr:hypothetical protein [uncultured marine thaumarchaeote SAT1000_12_G12]